MGRCCNSIVVDAPISEVWRTIRDFHDMAWATGVVSSITNPGTVPGDQAGARRILNGVFEETLLSLHDPTRSFSYRVDDGPGPLARGTVREYIGRVQLLPVTENATTFVIWESTFESPDDRAICEMCNPIYQGLLVAMRDHFAKAE